MPADCWAAPPPSVAGPCGDLPDRDPQEGGDGGGLGAEGGGGQVRRDRLQLQERPLRPVRGVCGTGNGAEKGNRGWGQNAFCPNSPPAATNPYDRRYEGSVG